MGLNFPSSTYQPLTTENYPVQNVNCQVCFQRRKLCFNLSVAHFCHCARWCAFLNRHFQSISLLPPGGGLHALLCLSLCDPQVLYSPRGSSVHGTAQARILGWVAISSSRGCSWLRDQTHIFCIGRPILYHWAIWEAQQKRLETLITYLARLPGLASKDSLGAQFCVVRYSGNVLEV